MTNTFVRYGFLCLTLTLACSVTAQADPILSSWFTQNSGESGTTQTTQGVGFDLDQYNGRNCVTPEFPGGTYAYFVTIDTSGTTAFPHMLGKQYYGTPNAGNATTVPGTAVELFDGGPNTQEVMRSPAVNASNGNVTLTWSSVEGGTYLIEATNDLTTSWTTLNAAVPAAANATQTATTEAGAALSTPKRFHRATRTGTAPYDPAYPGQ